MELSFERMWDTGSSHGISYRQRHTVLPGQKRLEGHLAQTPGRMPVHRKSAGQVRGERRRGPQVNKS